MAEAARTLSAVAFTAACTAAFGCPCNLIRFNCRVNHYMPSLQPAALPCSRQLLLRVLPGAGIPPSVCALPCSIPTDVAPSCQPGWLANGTDAAGVPM